MVGFQRVSLVEEIESQQNINYSSKENKLEVCIRHMHTTLRITGGMNWVSFLIFLHDLNTINAI